MTLIKSVSGVRGLVRADHPDDVTMTPGLAHRMGQAYATHLVREAESASGLVLAGGRDGRAGGDVLLAAFAEGALTAGVKVVDLGIATTPGVAMMVKALGAAGGVVITASHNPSEWNGIKLMTRHGHAPSATEAVAIFDIFDRRDFHDEPVQARAPRPVFDLHLHHVETVLQTVNADAIRRRSFSVVLDSINGAGARAGRMLLEALGCRVTHINAEPAATFAHTPEPIEANLRDLCTHVCREKADAGFAQDPDADRLAIVDEAGRFIGEEYTLALCAKRVFATRPGTAAANLSTSRMIDDVADAVGGPCNVLRSAVGEANVVETMKRHECVIGGEGNGGVIDPRVVHVRDSLVAMALVLDLLAAEGRSLSQVVSTVPAYAMIKDKVTCDAAKIARVLPMIRDAFPDGVANDVDGVRVDWTAERKWLHIRGSNTEPIMRIIVEAADRPSADALMARARQIIQTSP